MHIMTAGNGNISFTSFDPRKLKENSSDTKPALLISNLGREHEIGEAVKSHEDREVFLVLEFLNLESFKVLKTVILDLEETIISTYGSA